MNNGASGVYLGNYEGRYLVLTANHVGGGNFTLLGNTYSFVPGSYTQVASGLDLGIFAISGNSQLDSLTKLVLGSTLDTTTSVNLIGYGGGTKRGGYNTPEFANLPGSEQFVTYDGYTEAVILTDFDNVAGEENVFGEAQVIGGDSGGGVFFQNGSSLELSGLIVVAGVDDDTGKELTGAVDVGYYRQQILSAIPEASTLGMWLVLGAFAGGMSVKTLRRRV